MARKRITRTNRHHRLSRSRTKGRPFEGIINGVPNVKLVDYKQHQAFHKLFPDTHPHFIVQELNDKWLDPHYIVVAIPYNEAKQLRKYLKQLL
jgi:hypothetical protein